MNLVKNILRRLGQTHLFGPIRYHFRFRQTENIFVDCILEQTDYCSLTRPFPILPQGGDRALRKNSESVHLSHSPRMLDPKNMKKFVDMTQLIFY